MLPLGHMGLTLGVVDVVNSLVSRRSASRTTARAQAAAHPNPGDSPASHASPVDWLLPVSKGLDARVLLVGSLLPDFVDKTIGLFAFSSFFSNSRIFSHTMLFILLLWLVGFYLYPRSKGTNLLALALGSTLHLVFDAMWFEPETLFWPLFGWQFPKTDLSNWFWRMIHQLTTEPDTYVPEISGAIILCIVGVRLLQLKKVRLFLRTGRL